MFNSLVAIALIVPAFVIGTILQRVFYPSATLEPQLQVMHLNPSHLTRKVQPQSV